MYSLEERKRAIDLYIKFNKSSAATIHRLGYPNRKTLKAWYSDYLEEKRTGIIHDKYTRVSKYTEKQKEAAVSHYLEHGRCYSRTVRVLGYPNRETLRQWCHELAPEECKKRSGSIKCNRGQKTKAQEGSSSKGRALKGLAYEQENNGPLLPDQEKDPLLKEAQTTMTEESREQLQKKKEELLIEVDNLQKQIRRLKLERDIYDKAAELVKKDPSVDPKNLTNREKAILVDAVREDHPLQEAMECLGIKRNTYYHQRACLQAEGKGHYLKDKITKLFRANRECYGYRRIHARLAEEGICISEKIVRRVMKECSLIVFGKKKRKYSSYQGEKAPAAENLIARDFHADLPNIKWLTDITEFQIPAGKVYLSPIVDCFDGMLVSWTIGTSPDAELVNTMLDMAIDTLKPEEHPIVHSDRGAHYRWPGWLKLMEDRGLTRSMSRKGCSPDNSACEGVFGRVKNEMFYNRKWSGVSIEEFMEILNEYLYWYNEKRIKMSLGALSPIQYRRSLDLAA
jgi:transposase InsO family protein